MEQEENYLKKELYDLIKKDEKVFEFLQNASLDGLWYWDLEHPENRWMSPKFWTNLGYDPESKKHLSSEWQAIINPDDLKLALDNLKLHCSDPDNHSYDQIVQYTKQDGSKAWVRCRGLAIQDKNGNLTRMIGAHTDVSEVKKNEIELARMNELMKDRELKMIELKQEVNLLLKELGKPEKYTHQ